MSSIDCQYCNAVFPSYSESLRISLMTTKPIIGSKLLQAGEDIEFAKIFHKKYCCSSAFLDAQAAYDKYFPYHGMRTQQLYIDRINQDILGLSQMMKDLTPEKHLELTTEEDEIHYVIDHMVFLYQKLIELSHNTKVAYERETDPKRLKLLDGRIKENIPN